MNIRLLSIQCINISFSFLIAVSMLFSCKNSTKRSTDSINNSQVEKDTQSVLSVDSISYVMGKYDPDTVDYFVSIPDSMADRSGLLLREEAFSAFRQMYEHAQRDGIDLLIRSATRNFEYQKGIWERKWKGERLVGGRNLANAIPDPYKRAKEILLYSSMPGSSRHHWGTEVDINAFNNEWFETGKGLKLYEWLSKHASKYGFCQPYNDKNEHGRTGYEEEKWHWSYRPIADAFTAFAEANLSDEMISGFKGDVTADSVGIVKNYVLGLSEECMNN